MKLKTKKILDYYIGGPFLFLLKPFVIVSGKVVRRNHQLNVGREIVFLKFLGGGSLVIAFPALLGIRKQYPNVKLILVTTRPVESFAKILNIFNKILTIDDSSLGRLIISSFKVLLNCLWVDTVVDLEVYSRLSTLFALATMARNRIGFYLQDIFWRKNIHTHLIFLNQRAGMFIFYEQISYFLGGGPASAQECRESVLGKLPPRPRSKEADEITIGHGCSDVAKERMLSPEQWGHVFEKRIIPGKKYIVSFLGSDKDKDPANEIMENLVKKFPNIIFKNQCGLLPIAESVALIRDSDEFWGVDSSLIHFARLLGVPSVSFWGPTDPHTLLKPIKGLREEVYYEKIHCSPCVHVAETPPCNGNNICIRKLFDKNCYTGGKDSLFTTWST